MEFIVTHEYADGIKEAVYELSSYTGEGEGFMPLSSGMMRHYEAINLTDGYQGETEYNYVEDDDGNIVIFTEQIGIRVLPPPITSYSYIQDEMIEERLWNEGKYDESRLRHSINNFRILLHFFGRNPRNRGVAYQAIEWKKHCIHIMESLSENHEVPKAWWGFYADCHYITACTSFGVGDFEQGYAYLEKAFELYQKWNQIPNGTSLEFEDELIYGGIRFIKGKCIIELPNGKRESILDEGERILNVGIERLYNGMTDPHGWEWFDGIRNEARFKE